MAEPRLEPIASHAGPTRVLIVDDNRGDRVLSRKHLLGSQIRAFEIFEAQTGHECLELLAAQDVDLVLLDNCLPDAQGVEMIAKLRAAAQDSHLPVILLTGQGDESTAVDAMQHGANDYLPKSKVSTSVLSRAIGNALEKCELKRLVDSKRQKLEVANRELRHRNLEIREFYQTVSHELKTPVTAIREYNSLMLEGFGGEVSDVHQDYLTRSIDCCDRLTRLINDLLDAARLETGRMRIDLKLTDMGDLLDRCTETLAPLARAESLDLQCETEGPLPCMLVDPDRIHQILTNFVSNAIKNTGPGGRITVHPVYDSTRRELSVHVTDTGCGISPEDQKSIFERYFQVKANDFDFKEGLGIGLYLCGKLAELHGGNIGLRSQVGVGSTFTLKLPQKETVETAESAETTETVNG